MGVDVATSEFLGLCRAVGVDFGQTLAIGRQSRFGPSQLIAGALGGFGVVRDETALANELEHAEGWADPLFRELGATQLDALDRSDFEGATVLHDLNVAIPDALEGGWSCVFDGGVSEHVFGFTTSLENTMRLVAPGGHLVVSVPTNQEVGHGLYQVGPEMYFRTLVPSNGFQVCGVYLHEAWPVSRWFRLDDPLLAGRRIMFGTLGRAHLFVLARRVGPAGIETIPEQSDYAVAWETGAAPITSHSSRAGRLRQRIHRAAGPRAGAFLQNLRFVMRAARGAGKQRVRLLSEVDVLDACDDRNEPAVDVERGAGATGPPA